MNARIKKKQLKAKLELENQILDQEIANLNISLKKKQAKLKQKQAQIRAMESLIDSTKTIGRQRAKTLRTIFQYDEHSQKEEVGALIAKYHDYIDKGIIKPRSFVDNYDQASWMSSILTEPEMKKVIKQADKWMEMSAEKRAQRLANEPTIDF